MQFSFDVIGNITGYEFSEGELKIMEKNPEAITVFMDRISQMVINQQNEITKRCEINAGALIKQMKTC
jgi:hypothetical protein